MNELYKINNEEALILTIIVSELQNDRDERGYFGASEIISMIPRHVPPAWSELSIGSRACIASLPQEYKNAWDSVISRGIIEIDDSMDDFDGSEYPAEADDFYKLTSFGRELVNYWFG